MFVFDVITIAFAVQHCLTEEIGLCHDSKFFGNPTVREETMQEPKDGYVRCGIIHLGAHLKFDVVNETPQVTVLTVVVDMQSFGSK